MATILLNESGLYDKEITANIDETELDKAYSDVSNEWYDSQYAVGEGYESDFPTDILAEFVNNKYTGRLIKQFDNP